MKKFVKSKNEEGRTEDSNRLALFGSRSKSKSPAPSGNPYAQSLPDPYTQAKIDAGVAPPSGQPHVAPARGLPAGPKGGLPSGPRAGYGMNNPPQPSGQKHGSDNSYGVEKYSNQGGYNSNNPYGDPQSETKRPGGYGGLGSADTSREALFGGARDRYQQQSQSRPPPYDDSQSQGGYGSNERSYGSYADRQLTQEEEEEEDIQATKQDIRAMKQSDVSSTRNALRIAEQAEMSGRDTLARLGAQGERIHHTEKNLDLASNANKLAQDRAAELKRLNGSMFAVHVSNPFTSKSRAAERDNEIMKRHHDERTQREATRNAAFQSDQRMEKNFKDLAIGGPSGKQKGLAERARYQFENDSEDDAYEDEIENNIDALSGVAGRLNALARATGSEVETQNRHLERIAGKSDYVDDQIHMNRQRLDRIK